MQSNSDQSSQGSSQAGSINSGQSSSRPSTSQQAPRSVSPQSNNSKTNITSKAPTLEGAIPRTGLLHNIVSDSHDAHAASSSSVPIGKFFHVRIQYLLLLSMEVLLRDDLKDNKKCISEF